MKIFKKGTKEPKDTGAIEDAKNPETSENREFSESQEISESSEESKKSEESESPEEAEGADKAKESDSSEESEAAEESEEESAGEEKGGIGQEELERAYCLGAGIDEETLAKAKVVLAEIALASSGEFQPRALQLAIRLLNYDKALEEARQQGMELGRAEKIAEAFRDKRRKAEEAAGIPHLNGTSRETTLLANSIFTVAKGAK